MPESAAAAGSPATAGSSSEARLSSACASLAIPSASIVRAAATRSGPRARGGAAAARASWACSLSDSRAEGAFGMPN